MADEQLLSPFVLGSMSLNNRVALAPMTRARAGKERIPNKLMAEYYAQRAKAGLLITEATSISEQGLGWVDTPGIYSDAHVSGWRLVTDAVHEEGTPIFLQLWHCGRASHSSFHKDRLLPVSASAIKLNGEYIHTPEGKQTYETPRALETDEISAVVEDYRHAAQFANDAGFDGIEIHAANGYLIDQFLQSKTNQRTDSYGGSIKNRFKLLQDILQSVLTVWPMERVGVHLSPNGNYNDMGSSDFREQFSYAAQHLNGQIGYLHVVDGVAFGFHSLGEPITLDEARAAYKGPLIGNCGYTKQTAELAIASGLADLISFGRPYITNPDLVERFANDWPLAPDAPVTVWSAPGPSGYTDYPTYLQASSP